MIDKPKIAEYLEERGYRLTEIGYDIHWPGYDVTVLKINKVGAIELSKKFHVGEFDLKTSKECAEHIADKFDELLEQKSNYQCPHCEPDYLPVMCPDKIADECEHKDICVAVERGKSVEPFVRKHLKEALEKAGIEMEDKDDGFVLKKVDEEEDQFCQDLIENINACDTCPIYGSYDCPDPKAMKAKVEEKIVDEMKLKQVVACVDFFICNFDQDDDNPVIEVLKEIKEVLGTEDCPIDLVVSDAVKYSITLRESLMYRVGIAVGLTRGRFKRKDQQNGS